MIDWILFGIGVALNSGGGTMSESAAPMAVAIVPKATPKADVEEAPASAAVAEPVTEPVAAQPGFVAEPQVPSGKFTTAIEVKPILGATKGSWVAVREYNGKDLLYVTQLLSWRCGLHQMRYAVNGGPMQVFAMPPCHEGTAQPNAITSEDGLPYLTYNLGEVEFISVEVLYDDLSTEKASFMRADVLMP